MRVLAIDDEAASLEPVRAALGSECDLTCLTDGNAALELLRTRRFDVVITDLRMPEVDGLAILAESRRVAHPPSVLVLTAVDAARAAIEALREGAKDFLVKPAAPDVIRLAVARCVEGAERDPGREAPPELVGVSGGIRLVRELIGRLAERRESVLILGETGTGKELVARALHRAGPRRESPFVVHNMAATPAELTESLFFGHVRGAFTGAGVDHVGLFEQAERGTLFLDEIDSFPIGLQAKLLRVLETGCVRRVGSSRDEVVDVRVLAACACDAQDLVRRNLLRADLYYRLGQLEVRLPSLRERPEDLPYLVERFAREIAAEGGPPPILTPESTDALRCHAWPGNVRELRNAIRSAALLAGPGPIEPHHLPAAVREATRDQGCPAHASLKAAEIRHIRQVMDRVGGNRSEAARILGIDRGTLARKLKQP